jgi:hypothetical protein
MMSKLQREHDVRAAMLAFRTGLSASMCEAWIEAPIAKSAEAIKAAFLPASDDNYVIVARPEIEAYALARVKKYSQGGSWSGAGSRYTKTDSFGRARVGVVLPVSLIASPDWNEGRNP